MEETKSLPKINQNSRISDNSSGISKYKNYLGKGTSEYQSSSSLQHSISSISFPKQRRFSHNYASNHRAEFYQLPSTLVQKKIGIGYGDKKMLPIHILKNAKDIPGPGTYEINKIDSIISKTTRNQFINTHTQHLDDRLAPIEKSSNPGPGSYETDIKNSIRFISLKGNTCHRKSLSSNFPTPFTYNPKFNIVLQKNIREIKLGTFSSRPDIIKTQKNSPGPGSYNIPSFTKSVFLKK